MLRLQKEVPVSQWEAALPAEVLELNEELRRVDELLEDERFYQPFIKKNQTRMGRPTTPIRTYLRIMYLKFRYQLSYEVLVAEVADSFKWRKFCHLGLVEAVPDATTLIKLTQRYGEDSVQQLNELLVKKAYEKKIVRGKRLRADTTVVEANIQYPTDEGLLATGVRVISRIVQRVKSAGVPLAGRFRDRTKEAKGLLRQIHQKLAGAGKGSKKLIAAESQKMLALSRKVVAAGQAVLDQIKGKGRRVSERVKKERDQLAQFLQRTQRVIEQTETVLRGQLHIKERLVSLFDTLARPIKKGKAGKPTEFGRKVLIVEGEHGVITDYKVLAENPPDASLVESMIDDHKKRFGNAPDEVATDGGFAKPGVTEQLEAQGVKRVAIPSKKVKERQQQKKKKWFCRLQNFRAGSEARISLLKRKFSLARTLSQRAAGAEGWIGWGVLSQNLWQMARAR